MRLDNDSGCWALAPECSGNEPDMYSIPSHGHRNSSYGPYDYLGEFSDLLTQIDATGSDPTGQGKSKLIGPNIANFGAGWHPENVWDTGFVDKFDDNLAYLAVEKYVS